LRGCHFYSKLQIVCIQNIVWKNKNARHTILHWWQSLNEQKAHVLIDSVCQCYIVHRHQFGQCLLTVSVAVNVSAAVNTDRYIQCRWHRLSHWIHSVGVASAAVLSWVTDKWQFYSICTETAHPYLYEIWIFLLFLKDRFPKTSRDIIYH